MNNPTIKLNGPEQGMCFNHAVDFVLNNYHNTDNKDLVIVDAKETGKSYVPSLTPEAKAAIKSIYNDLCDVLIDTKTEAFNDANKKVTQATPEETKKKQEEKVDGDLNGF